MNKVRSGDREQAREGSQELAEGHVEISILDRSVTCLNTGVFTFIPFGLYTEKDAVRDRKKILSPQCFFGEDGEVVSVDIEEREVAVKSGRRFSLVIATGCI